MRSISDILTNLSGVELINYRYLQRKNSPDLFPVWRAIQKTGKPHTIGRDAYGPFICVPFRHTGGAIWLFESEDSRSHFISDFGGEAISQ